VKAKFIFVKVNLIKPEAKVI